MSWKEERLDKGTSRQTGDYLFKFPEKETATPIDPALVSQALQARTRITGPHLMSSILFYSTIDQVLGSEYARIIHDNICRCMISQNGVGRSEAVEVLSGGLPDEKVISRGNV